MNSEDNMREMARARRVERDRADDRYAEKSGERLKTGVEKKIRTSFIGALSEFEKAFGHWWAHGVAERYLTDEELENRRIWEQVRINILNNGNNQIRAIQKELAEYKIEWNRHKSEWKMGN